MSRLSKMRSGPSARLKPCTCGRPGQQTDGKPTRGAPEYRAPCWITAKLRDVGVHPVECGTHIVESVVARALAAFERELGVGEKSHGPEPVGFGSSQV